MPNLHRRGRATTVRVLVTACTALTAFALGASTAPAAVFSQNSFWNRPLSATAPLDGSSSSLVASLNAQVRYYGEWINTSSYSTPVYTVPRSQPNVRVTLDTSYPALQSDFDAVPIPADAQPAGGTDQHLTVYQPSTDT